MATHATLVIRGGTIVDGSGAPAFTADVAVDGDQIAAIGPDLVVTGSPREIDARGKLVTPGWIDVHTHYDAQATWDPLLTPSAHCGVTTSIMGNCGVGFAPCQKELRPFLLGLMEAVEDIPGSALAEGIQWEWETFPEYLDALGRRQYGCDVAVMIGHGGVRTWVMGKRASVSDRPGGPEKDPVTDEEIAAIASVVREAVAAGALGFSTSRLLLHRDNKGILTPGALAAKKELLKICDAIAEGGGGVFEMSADFSGYDDIPYPKLDPKKRADFFGSELGWMAQAMSEHSNLKVTFGIGPDQVPFFSKWANSVCNHPNQCVVQFQTRPQSYHMSHASGRNVFMPSKTYRKIRKAAKEDLPTILEMLRDAGTKEAIIGDLKDFKPVGDKNNFGGQMMKNADGIIIPGWMIDGTLTYPWHQTYEPTQDTMIANLASAHGQDPLSVCYDYLLDTSGSHAGVLWHPLFGYTGNNDNITKALKLPNAIPGFDDAGAHCTILTDATCATSNITYYGRDRTTGKGTLPLETLVKTQTLDAALLFGLTDRGVLTPGKRADINVMDLEKLNIKPPFWVNDLPTKAGRWLQYTEGYVCTVLRGIVTFEHDQHTGALPGRLVRNFAALGIDAVAPGAAPARLLDDSVASIDLSERAVELSRGGGASALARVLNDRRAKEKKLDEARSRL